MDREGTETDEPEREPVVIEQTALAPLDLRTVGLEGVAAAKAELERARPKGDRKAKP